MGRNARERVLDNFTHQRRVDQLQQMAKGRRPAFNHGRQPT
jgi:hypothetical protein